MLVLDEADKMFGDSSQDSFSADILAIVSSFREFLTEFGRYYYYFLHTFDTDYLF